jgi:hypothetical protein
VSRNPSTVPPERVTRDDIEAKLRELRGEVDDRATAAKVPAAAIGIGIALFVVVLAYWFGRRRGKRSQMVLEIRRI